MITRREALLTGLFGGGMLGLRALATGIPAKVLLDPRKALADMTPNNCTIPTGAAQYVIFATSGQGDPIGCNAPGTYLQDNPNLTNIVHASPADGSMAPTTIPVGGGMVTAAAPWAMLNMNVGTNNTNILSRTCFCHIMTNTPVHPKEPQVLQLMGTTLKSEMFPSVLSAQLAPCLGTLQAQPISIGALTPSEALTFQGQALPTIPPSAMRATLANPTGELTNLQPIRDATLNAMYQVYTNGATKAQQNYIDSVVTSQQQVRNINQSLLANLESIADNSIASQISAAVTLIQMNVSPVIAIHIDFGADNHSDPGLATESSSTVGGTPQKPTGGVSAIAALMTALGAANLLDQVSLVSLNVFNRTMYGTANNDGRQHNPYHQMSLMIGKPFASSLVGGLAPINSTAGVVNGNTLSYVSNSQANEFGALPISSQTGAGSMSGDIQPVDTLASFGMTVMTGVGVPAATVNAQIPPGLTTAKVIQGALAAT
jgi:hypothetical protein